MDSFYFWCFPGSFQEILMKFPATPPPSPQHSKAPGGMHATLQLGTTPYAVILICAPSYEPAIFAIFGAVSGSF